MNTTTKVPNRLINEKSPYLLQHAHNPVNWFPWCDEAFNKAKTEDKPIFLSIGYSTCHWCHVMEHESFEDIEVADMLNRHYVCIKVDKEERPDIDSIYMNVCQLYTGNGGWPTTIIMTWEQKPFFAGTYLPKFRRFNSVGLIELLELVKQKWKNERDSLEKSGQEIVSILSRQQPIKHETISNSYILKSIMNFKRSFEKDFGGFGHAPKFPTPHNLMFLLDYYDFSKDEECLKMVEKTLDCMYKGGIFDHIGFGFSRYSTDKYWLAPHFEKMLYDNALLTISYLRAFQITKNEKYKTVAQKTIDYVVSELSNPEGGFFSAQDADSDGVEGKYYLFTPNEIISLLGEQDGTKFNKYFDITEKGNFENKNIPNLIKTEKYDKSIEKLLPIVNEYRKNRTKLHKDDKVLSSWNSLMISALALAYKTLGEEKYLVAAKEAIDFIDFNLAGDSQDTDQLYVSFREGKRSNNGFLDDYAFYIYALIEMYQATFDERYFIRALQLNKRVISDFYDIYGGFYLYGKNAEQLILRPKETYDGAIPSGNSVMAHNLMMLSYITNDSTLDAVLHNHFNFMCNQAYNTGNSFFMLSLLKYIYPPKKVVCVLKNSDELENIVFPDNAIIRIFHKQTEQYPLINDQTTYYICENNSCKPPVNSIR